MTFRKKTPRRKNLGYNELEKEHHNEAQHLSIRPRPQGSSAIDKTLGAPTKQPEDLEELWRLRHELQQIRNG